jgi:TldD protein
MKDALTIAKTLLLTPTSIDESSLDQLMRSMLNRHIDEADLYFQTCSYESWSLEDSHRLRVAVIRLDTRGRHPRGEW